MSELQCVVVTPEKTEIDVKATSVTVPMFDGEMGILKGHSPLVGRLGFGALRIHSASGPQTYFVEGGFVQVAANVVSVLTDSVRPISELTSAAAQEAMKVASEMPTGGSDLMAARQKAQERARAMSRLANS